MRFTNRLLLVFFMIALLPFRALAGDVMATQMAAGQAQSAQLAQLAQLSSDHATNNVAARAHIDSATGTFDVEKTAFEVNQSVHVAKAANAAPVGTVLMAAMPDCPGHAQSGAFAQTDATKNGGADGNADSCSACQACHSVAIASPSGAFLSTSSTPAQPLAVAIDFTSASLALGQKPPIS